MNRNTAMKMAEGGQGARLRSYLSRLTSGFSWSEKFFMSSATLSLPEGANTDSSTYVIVVLKGQCHEKSFQTETVGV